MAATLRGVYKREGMGTPDSKAENALERKGFPFQAKEFAETGTIGTIAGIASPYGVLDLGGDVVEPGAFTKTIAERGNRVTLKDSHGTRIGVAEVRDSGAALEAHGLINLDKQSGRDAYSDLKFYRDNGLPMGLSIGYKTIKADYDSKGVRHLREVLLGEVSITEFPMNPDAQVTAVKSETLETKSGRMFSAANKDKIKSACMQMKDAHDLLLALIAEEAAEEDTEGTSPREAAGEKSEPMTNHSALIDIATAMKHLYIKENE